MAGHVESAPSGECTIEALATEVSTLGRVLGVGRTVVVGHSLGAMVALALYKQSPDLVDAIATLDPAPLSQEFGQLRRPARTVAPGPRRHSRTAKVVEGIFLPSDDADRRRRIIDIMCSVPNDVAIPLVTAMGIFDSVGALRECDVPFLTIGSAVPVE